VDNIGWRITEPDTRKFDKAKLKTLQIPGVMLPEMIEKGFLIHNEQKILLDDISWIRKGDVFAAVIDTKYCPQAVEIAKGARILLCESTYLEEHAELAYNHYHMTAKQAAQLAKEAGVEELILTHFSARYLNLKDFETEARTIFKNTYAADDLMVFPFPKNREKKN
jgi:ribonuclease Z